MNISFLLGAGFSRAAGLSLRDDVNKKIKTINEQNYFVSIDNMLYKKRNNNKNMSDYWPLMCNVIHDYVKKCDNLKLKFDYESFYDYLVWCIKIDEQIIGKYDLLRSSEIDNTLFQLSDLYMQLVTWVVLPDNANTYYDYNTSKYEYFKKWIIALQNNKNKIFVNTLNHDLLIESIFYEQNINDGFVLSKTFFQVEIEEGKKSFVPFYDKAVYKKKRSSKNINLIKLHGSFDYYKDSKEHKLLKCPRGAAIHWIEKRNSQSVIENYAPQFLVGNRIKLDEYETPYYKDRHDIFKKILSESKALFVIGYGFGDDGINNDINEHFNGNLLYVIDPTTNEKSCAIKNKCSFLRDRVKFLNKSIEDLTYNDFMQINQDFYSSI